MSAQHTQPGSENGQSPIIRLVKVSRSFGQQQVLSRINLEIHRGMTTVILGPSGCGKTVLLKHIIGLLKPDSGEVWFEQDRIDLLNEAKLNPIRKQFGMLFQQSALFDSMSVRQNVSFPLVEHTVLKPDEREKRIRRVLRMVGLVDAIDKMPAELSGGQRKRIALARAIILEPKVILYDEPTTGLDPIRADIINELIIKLQRALNITSIVVTHDLTCAFKIAQRMVMLYDGELVMEGDLDTFRNTDHPLVHRFMLGEASEDELRGIHVGSDERPMDESGTSPGSGS